MKPLSIGELKDRFATIRAELGRRVDGIRLGELAAPLPNPSGLSSRFQYSWFLSQIANGGHCGVVVLLSSDELSRSQFYLEEFPEFSDDGLVIGSLLYDPLVLRSTAGVFVLRDGIASPLAQFEELVSALVSSAGYLEIIGDSADGWGTFLREQNML